MTKLTKEQLKSLSEANQAMISKKREVAARLSGSQRPCSRESYIESLPIQRMITLLNPTEFARASISMYDIDVVKKCLKDIYQDALYGFFPEIPMLKLLEDCYICSIENDIPIESGFDINFQYCSYELETEPVDYNGIIQKIREEAWVKPEPLMSFKDVILASINKKETVC